MDEVVGVYDYIEAFTSVKKFHIIANEQGWICPSLTMFSVLWWTQMINMFHIVFIYQWLKIFLFVFTEHV